MSDSVVIILKRPEGYEDVCAELVAEDFLKNNGAGLKYEATEATKDTSPLLDEMAEVMGKIEKYYDFPNEVLEEIAPEWLADVIQVMEKYREQVNR